MEVRDKAKQDYLAGMKPKEIAAKYDVSPATVRSWKSRYWSNETVATQHKNVATKKKNVATQQKVHPAVEKLLDTDLTDKQKMFVIEYTRLANATQAYINAYGCEYSTAMVQGSLALRKPKIQEEVKRLRLARLQELNIDVFSLVDDLGSEAKADIGSYVDWGTNEFDAVDEDSGKQYIKHKSWVALKDKSQVDSKAIKKITVGKDGAIVELHDRNKARDKLLEYLLGKGVFEDNQSTNEISITMDTFEGEEDAKG